MTYKAGDKVVYTNHSGLVKVGTVVSEEMRYDNLCVVLADGLTINIAHVKAIDDYIVEKLVKITSFIDRIQGNIKGL